MKGTNKPSKKRKYNSEPMINSPGASCNVELEGSNASLQKRMAELQKEMDNLLARMSAEMAAMDVEWQNSLANKPSKKRKDNWSATKS